LFKIQKRIIYAIEAVLDIALNAGAEPVQNISIAKRQGIPKRYLEQTLQVLVKSKILVASRGPRGGYRLAKERRKIKILDVVIAVSDKNQSSELYKSKLSKIIIEPLIERFLNECKVHLENISVEDIYNKFKHKNYDTSKKKVDFVI
jgi:Rrf2 family protein|tara:strand:- start:2665 stop:3105 length:441 start_codon:yes stop_codon:yes gene_type:complete